MPAVQSGGPYRRHSCRPTGTRAGRNAGGTERWSVPPAFLPADRHPCRQECRRYRAVVRTAGIPAGRPAPVPAGMPAVQSGGPYRRHSCRPTGTRAGRNAGGTERWSVPPAFLPADRHPCRQECRRYRAVVRTAGIPAGRPAPVPAGMPAVQSGGPYRRHSCRPSRHPCRQECRRYRAVVRTAGIPAGRPAPVPAGMPAVQSGGPYRRHSCRPTGFSVPFQLLQQRLEVVALAQGVEVGVLLHVGDVLVAFLDGLLQQRDGTDGVLLLRLGFVREGGRTGRSRTPRRRSPSVLWRDERAGRRCLRWLLGGSCHRIGQLRVPSPPLASRSSSDHLSSRSQFPPHSVVSLAPVQLV